MPFLSTEFFHIFGECVINCEIDKSSERRVHDMITELNVNRIFIVLLLRDIIIYMHFLIVLLSERFRQVKHKSADMAASIVKRLLSQKRSLR